MWLAQALDIPICGPESIVGSLYSRPEYILRNAIDIGRSDVWRGGITALKKTASLFEAFGLRCEVHGPGVGNLQVLGAIKNCEYYERGLLHPLVPYEGRTPWLKEIVDPMDKNGYVKMPQKPGLGMEINWNFIEENTI